jgi:serine/threonine-protein kinase
MEYVHGEALSRLLRGRGPVEPAIASSVLAGTLYGLHAAHEATDARGAPLGIVHRDVSPANILVGADGIARVVDFGVAKAAGRLQTTRDGTIKGKLAYMAPEQLAGRGVDRRSDVWAAGCVLWEMLAGRRLFAADDQGELVASVLYGEIPALDELVPELAAVGRQALARVPAERFATAQAMGMALVAAGPPAPPHEVGAWVEACAHEVLAQRRARIGELETIALRPARRSRVLAATAGLAAAVGVAGALVLAPHGGSPAAERPPVPATASAPPPPAPPPVTAPDPVPARVAPPAPVASSPAPRPPPHRHTVRAAADDCDPPYTRDSEGHKIWKRACFARR